MDNFHFFWKCPKQIQRYSIVWRFLGNFQKNKIFQTVTTHVYHTSQCLHIQNVPNCNYTCISHIAMVHHTNLRCHTLLLMHGICLVSNIHPQYDVSTIQIKFTGRDAITQSAARRYTKHTKPRLHQTMLRYSLQLDQTFFDPV